jgi:hypothetical protein
VLVVSMWLGVVWEVEDGIEMMGGITHVSGHSHPGSLKAPLLGYVT